MNHKLFVLNPFEKYLKPEDRVHIQVCQYLGHKGCLFHHSPNEGKRSPFERWLVGLLGMKKGFPDVFVFEPVGGFMGLALELKADNASPFKKDGTYKKEYATGSRVHQRIWLEELRKRGYKAEFGIGYEHSIGIIKEYFNG